MTPGAPTASTDAVAAGIEGRGVTAERADTTGRLLRQLSLLPVLLATAWLLAGLPLLLIGKFTLVLMLVVSLPLALALVIFGLRWIPDRSQGVRSATHSLSRTPWWALAGVIAVAVAFGAHQMIYRSEQMIVTRDPASYVQFGYWIAHHGSTLIPQRRAAFGGLHKGLMFGSAAFYQVGHRIVPQFMAGLPMVLSAGFWIGGIGAALAMAPLLGACAVLTFGGLVARLVGPRWAPAGALVLALTFPEQFTSRSTYSEPLTQIMFLGGLCLILDSLDADRAGAQVIAALGGLAAGLSVLVRIDGVSDLLPLIPYGGLLVITRRRQALPLIGGLALGAGYGAIDGIVLSRPYLHSIKSSLYPLGMAIVAAVILTVVAVAVLWGRGLPKVRGQWLPAAVAMLPVAVIIGFVIRPYLQTVRDKSFLLVHIAKFQLRDHLPIDPERTYAEISLHWVFWYIGVPAVLLATAGAAVLSRRCLMGREPRWTLPLLAFAWTIVTCLYRPAIVPIHPWASRRLVPAVLPGFILLALWAASWLVSWLRQRGYGRVAGAALASCCALTILVPTATTTFGLRIERGGPLGVQLGAAGLAFKRTYQGEVAALEGVCDAIPPNSSVILNSTVGGNRYAQIIRGMCGVPAAVTTNDRYQTVHRIVLAIKLAGRRPVILTPFPATIKGLHKVRIMNLRIREDDTTLTNAPLKTLPGTVTLWMAEP
jgi:hypothetical protein